MGGQGDDGRHAEHQRRLGRSGEGGGRDGHARPDLLQGGRLGQPEQGRRHPGGLRGDKLFTEGTWNAEFCKDMTPKDGDVVVKGKKGLDAFPGTTLEEELKAPGIETVALAGFLTNCCVESTMRTAYEKGFNVITLTDCVATTSEEGQKAATTGTYGMFSSPMTSGEFKEKLA